MRHLAILLGLVLASWLAAGCEALWPSGTVGWGGFLIPAHNERYYAGMSVSAFGADGSLYVLNGDTLLHYSAEGVRLGSTPLPAEVQDAYAVYAPRPLFNVTPDTGIQAFQGREKFALLQADGQLAWVKDLPGLANSQLQYADGWLVDQATGFEHSISYLDRAGDIKWSVPGTWINPFSVQVDQQGRAYFMIHSQLIVMDASGTELLRKDLPHTQDWPTLNCAGHGRVIVVPGYNKAQCLDLNGDLMWEMTLPDDGSIYDPGIVLSPDRIVLALDYMSASDSGMAHRLLTVDSQGQIVAQSAGYGEVQPYLWNGQYLLAQTNSSRGYAWACFTAAGKELWSYGLQSEYGPLHPAAGSTVIKHSWFGGIVAGPDRRTYFDNLSTLYALDKEGNVVWQDAGTVFHDVWVEEHSSGT
jgi:hypothetical protein